MSSLDTPSVSRIAQRIAELRREHEAGQAQLRALEQRTRELQHTLLRIAGAIAVLEEMEAEGQAGGD
jgi:hypothetical protein